MFSLKTWEKIWESDIRMVFSGDRPLCTDFSPNPPCREGGARVESPIRARRHAEDNFNNPTFIMYACPLTGEVWYESSVEKN